MSGREVDDTNLAFLNKSSNLRCKPGISDHISSFRLKGTVESNLHSHACKIRGNEHVFEAISEFLIKSLNVSLKSTAEGDQ